MIVRVLSDDLTGALDTAAMFAGTGAATVTWEARPNADSLAHCLDTRSASRESAMAAMAVGAPWLTAGDIALKKCDSRLRGHVAAELVATLKASSVTRAVVAPSFPAQGRTMVGGRVLTKCPTASRTEPVDLAAELRSAGMSVRLAEPGEAIGEGITIADAASDVDLDRIVSAGLGTSSSVLWCGSAGLAGALARRLGTPRPPLAKPKGPCLIAIGTDHHATLRQLAALRAAAIPLRDISLADDGGALPADGGMDPAAAIDAALRGETHVLATLTPATPCSEAAADQWIAASTAQLARAGLKHRTAIVTGGATLLALVEALGASAIELHGQFADGVPVGRMAGGAWDGVGLVSKSGGFGDPRLLVELLEAADRG